MSGPRWYFILSLTFSLWLTGCAGEATTTPPASPTTLAVASTQPAPATEVVTTSTAVSTPTEAPTATEVPAPTETTVPTETPAPTEAPALPEMPSLSAADAIRAAMRAQGTGGPYHAESTIVSADGTSILSADVIPPDQLHSTINVDGSTQEIVITGGQMWLNDGSGWGEPMSGEAVTAFLSQLLNDPDSSGMTLTNEQFVGVETLNGSPVWVYTYTQTLETGGTPIVSESRLWVEITTGLPLKVEGTGTAFGITSTTTQVITYDDSITISAPQ